jgi:flagellar motor switch protein FliM
MMSDSGIDDEKKGGGESFTSNEIDRIIDDVESEYFSFAYVPAITKTQRNSVQSLMKGVAEKVSEVFRAYRNESVSFGLGEIDSCLIEDFLQTISDDSILFSFDFDGIQCEMDVSLETYKKLTGMDGVDRKGMTSVDSKLCFDFVMKPILTEMLKKINMKSSSQVNFRSPKVIEKYDVLNPKGRCVFVGFSIKISSFKSDISLVFPIEAFESLVQLGVFSRPRRPLQNPFKYDSSVVLDRIYLDPNLELEIGDVIETTKKADDKVEILTNGKKVRDGELVAVRELFGVRRLRP